MSVNYAVEEGRIRWDLETLSIQAWRRIPEQDINKAIAEVAVKPPARRRPAKTLPYVAIRIVEAETGDIIYSVRLTRGNIRIGLLRAIPLLKNKALLWGAILDPIPLIIEKIVENVEPSLDSYINNNMEDIIDKATPAEREEAEKILDRIKTVCEKLEKQRENPKLSP
ncbi:MAG: hypothetical protein P3X22_004200 [Thermoprotei archaeon]|nr:hypothetical protein [Thermoprotei archaeon]